MNRVQQLAALACVVLLAATAPAQGIGDLRHHDPDGRNRRPHPGPVVQIVKHHVTATIEDTVATTKVSQVFRNRGRAVLEGTYLFPVPENASLTEFTMVMNGKTVKGEVLESDKARKIYEDIVRRSRDPGLLEYAGKRLFRARVFPIPAAGEVEISLSYVESLESADGVVGYRYPLKTQAFSSEPVADVAVTVTIEAASDLKSVFSSSHAIDSQRRSERKTTVSYEGKRQACDRDFQLYYTLSDREFGLHLMSHRGETGDGYFLMTLAPKTRFRAEEILPKDVIFVVDTSGSMKEDQKMEQARGALVHGIKGLNVGDRFNVVAFSTEARPMAAGLVAFEDAEVARALDWVKELEARGGTNIHDALVSSLGLQGSDDRVKILVFVTDGLPTVGETGVEKILGAARKIAGDRVRIFTFGVGYDVNTDLVDALAEDNGGTRDYVTPSQNLEIVLSRFFDKIASPVMTDLVVEVDGLELSDVYPKTLGDLFRGDQLTVLGRYAGSGTKAVRLRGKVAGTEREYVYEGRFEGKKSEREFISVLWAKRKVGFLWDQIRLNGENAELKEEIVRLGKSYGIATPYTSFLVLEDEPLASGAVPATADPSTRRSADFFGERLRDRRPAEQSGEAGRRLGGGGADGGLAPGAPTAGRNAVVDSLRRKALKETLVPEAEEVAEDRDVELGDEARRPRVRIQRLEGRTFENRAGVWVEVSLDDMKEEEREKKTEKVEAFSDRYFELLRLHPELSRILARMPEAMIRVGDRVVWITAPKEEAPEAPPAEAPKAPEGSAGSKG